MKKLLLFAYVNLPHEQRRPSITVRRADRVLGRAVQRFALQRHPGADRGDGGRDRAQLRRCRVVPQGALHTWHGCMAVTTTEFDFTHVA